MKRATLILGLVALAAAFAAPSAGAMGKPRVAALQVGLAAKGLYGGTIDGVWGPMTERAVRRLQRRARIAVDGVPGPQTRRALGALGRHPLGSRVLRPGHVGWDVSMTQFMLAWHGFPSGTFDGGFGPRTERAARRFQRWARIGVDGRPGPMTFRALRGPLPRARISLSRPVGIGVTDRFGPRGRRFHTGLDFPAVARGARARGGRRARRRRALDTRAATGTSWSSSTGAAGRRGTRICRGSASGPARGSRAGASSAASARPEPPPARTCTSSCACAARR